MDEEVLGYQQFERECLSCKNRLINTEIILSNTSGAEWVLVRLSLKNLKGLVLVVSPADTSTYNRGKRTRRGERRWEGAWSSSVKGMVGTVGWYRFSLILKASSRDEVFPPTYKLIISPFHNQCGITLTIFPSHFRPCKSSPSHIGSYGRPNLSHPHITSHRWD